MSLLPINIISEYLLKGAIISYLTGYMYFKWHLPICSVSGIHLKCIMTHKGRLAIYSVRS